MSKIDNPEVARVFDGYPEPMRKKMMRLRQLVLDTASETEGVDAPEETLKWGEPSYLTKDGSTIRMDWKARAPDRYAMYFNCNTSLVATFKAVYGDVFTFEDNRAIVFGETDEFPVDELKHCISLRSDISSRETSTVARRLTETLNVTLSQEIVSWTRLTSKRR